MSVCFLCGMEGANHIDAKGVPECVVTDACKLRCHANARVVDILLRWCNERPGLGSISVLDIENLIKTVGGWD